MEVLQLPLVLSNPLTVGKQQAVGESQVLCGGCMGGFGWMVLGPFTYK